MAITIEGVTFDGPHRHTSSLEDRSGVYAIFTQLSNGNFRLLDIGESAKVRTRVSNHDRAGCWDSNKANGVYYAACYTPDLQQAGRMEVEQHLRSLRNLPCGNR